MTATGDASNGYTLTVTDTTGRAVKNMSLTKVTGAGLAASATYTSGELKITAIDPNISAETIASEFTITQGTYSSTGASAAITTTKHETEFQRFTANYAVGSATNTFKAVIGSGANAITSCDNNGAHFIFENKRCQIPQDPGSGGGTGT